MSTGTVNTGEPLPAGAEAPGTPDENSNKRFLIAAYICAVLIPIIGIIFTLILAVAQKRAAVRRHAISVGIISVLAAGAYLGIYLAANASRQDTHVASDLRSLLDSNYIQYDSVGNCAHQSGNLYLCMVTQNGKQITVTVTDDGHTIYEQGIGK